MRLSDPGAVEAIGELLGATVRQAPFGVPRATPGRPPRSEGPREPVYQLTMPSEGGEGTLLITLWPTLARVDVRLGNHYWVLRDVDVVDLYPGVEVLFRRNQPPAYLFVSVKGRVALVA
jgi:hypothetical protein